MKEKTLELSEQEVKMLIKNIAAPTFKYMMRRINRNIIQDKKLSQISINTFITILIASLSSIDANTLRWIEKFYKMKLGQDIDFDKLKSSLTIHLHEQLGIELH